MKNKKNKVIIIGGVLAALGIGVSSVFALKENKIQSEHMGNQLENVLVAQVQAEDREPVYEEWILYQGDNNLWKIKTDGTSKQKILDLGEEITWAYLEGENQTSGHIYYLYEGNLIQINLDDQAKEKISDKVFDTIDQLVNGLTGEKQLVVKTSKGSDVLLINKDGSQETLKLTRGVKKIMIQGEDLVYLADGGIYQYSLKQSQGKRVIAAPKDNSLAYPPAIDLIGLEGEYFYYTIQGVKEYIQDVYKVNMKTLVQEVFYQMESGMDDYGDHYIDNGYLYTSNYETRHSIHKNQLSLKDGEIKSQGWVIGQDDDWVYKLQEDKINKFNLKTEEEVLIRHVQPLEWYTDFKTRSGKKIGDWIYFNDYNQAETGEVLNDPQKRPLDNYRINIKSGKEEEIAQIDSYLNMAVLEGGEGSHYGVGQREIVIIKGDRLEELAVLEQEIQNPVLVTIKKEETSDFVSSKLAGPKEEWIYYNLKVPQGEWNHKDVIYRAHTDGSRQEKVLDIGGQLSFWAIEEGKVIYGTQPDWLTYFSLEAEDKKGLWENNFLNAIYSANLDGTGQKTIVIGDIYQAYDPDTGIYGGFDQGEVIQQYNIILVKDGWIYFQIQGGIAETDWKFEPNYFSKIRVDGTDLTKISDIGIEGSFVKEKDDWAYFDSEQWPGEFYDIGRLNLITGEKNTMAEGAAMVGIEGNTMYFYKDYKEGLYKMDLTRMEEEYLAPVSTDYYWDAILYLEGNKIYQTNDDGQSKVIYTLDPSEEEEQMKYLYDIEYVEELDGTGQAGPSHIRSYLYKKDLLSGHRTILTSHVGEIEEIRMINFK